MKRIYTTTHQGDFEAFLNRTDIEILKIEFACRMPSDGFPDYFQAVIYYKVVVVNDGTKWEDAR